MKITAKNSAGYQSPAGLAVDPVVFTVENSVLKVLLVKDEEGASLPGGFSNFGVDPEDSVREHLESKTEVSAPYLEQLRTYAAPDRDYRGWIPSIAYIGLLSADTLPEASKGLWADVANMPELSFDHNTIVADARDRLRNKVWESNISKALLPDQFSMTEARKVFEAITDTSYNASNFKRDLENSGLIEVTGDIREQAVGRPAKTYKFVSLDPQWIKRR